MALRNRLEAKGMERPAKLGSVMPAETTTRASFHGGTTNAAVSAWFLQAPGNQQPCREAFDWAVNVAEPVKGH